MSQEKFNLAWNTYNNHLKEMMKNIMDSSEFNDVTLVSDDKKKFKAHKVVLSSCSPLFKNILREMHANDSVIYLRGIFSVELESLLQFIYLGEATLYQERMQEFLDSANSLELKEIGNNTIEDDTYFDTKTKHKMNIEPSDQSNNENRKTILDSSFKNSISSINNESSRYNCTICRKDFYDANTCNRHVKTVHDGVKYPCDNCGKVLTQIGHLNRHKRTCKITYSKSDHNKAV